MNVGQWKRISGPAGGGSLVAAALAPTRANFDAYGTGTFGTFASLNASLGTFNAANMTTFSKGAINTSRMAILLSGGGHSAYQDGSFYRFDILGNCTDVNSSVTPRGWAVAAKSGKLMPVGDPQPSNCYSSATTFGFDTGTANGTSGTNQITITGITWSNPAHQTISVGDRITTGATPSAIPAGATAASWSPSGGNAGTVTLSDLVAGGPCNLQSNLVNVSVRNMHQGANFWSGLSAAGQQMPPASHTYSSWNWIPRTTKLATGGNFAGIDNVTQPGGYIYDDSQPDGSNVVFANITGKGYGDDRPLVACPGDTNPSLYGWDQGTLYRRDAPWPGGASTTLGTGKNPTPPEFNEAVIIADPVNAGKWAFWSHIANQTTSGGFGMILNLFPLATATYTAQAGTYTVNPSTFGWQGQNNDSMCYNPDLGMPVVYAGGTTNGNLQKVSIDSSANGTPSDVFTSPSGDIPAAGGSPRLAYDSVHKCYIVQKTGDVFIVKAA
jgi:hypothetical protein